MPTEIPGPPVWLDSNDVCALTDGERHLGHIVYSTFIYGGEWNAFDTVHSNEQGDGFRYVGMFATAALAKAAVERSVLGEPPALTKSAAAGFWIS